MGSANSTTKIPEQFRPLFWDVKFENIHMDTHARFIIERLLEYGTWEGILFLRGIYGDERIRDYILKRGYKVLSKKTLNFWKYLLHLEHEECLQPSSLNNSRPLWNY